MGAISGIDWAADWHDVHIADEHGELLAAEQLSHDELGVSALIELLLDHRVELLRDRAPRRTARRTAAGSRHSRAGDPPQPGRGRA